MSYIPLPHSPAVFLDSQAPLDTLYALAMHRIGTARELMQSLSSLTLSNSDDQDLKAVVNDANLLLEKGCAVLEVVEARGAFLRRTTP